MCKPTQSAHLPSPLIGTLKRQEMNILSPLIGSPGSQEIRSSILYPISPVIRTHQRFALASLQHGQSPCAAIPLSRCLSQPTLSEGDIDKRNQNQIPSKFIFETRKIKKPQPSLWFGSSIHQENIPTNECPPVSRYRRGGKAHPGIRASSARRSRSAAGKRYDAVPGRSPRRYPPPG
ncbi:MAG: hypothetical protein JWR03_2904 [Cohnella sp.]|nr:hypothetical protein [Cohnella sp.]